MKCGNCNGEVPFMEWFIHAYKHKDCRAKERDAFKKKEVKPSTEPEYSWETPHYKSYNGFRKFIYWFGLVMGSSFAILIVLPVRIIQSLMFKDNDKRRLEVYAKTHSFFGYCFVFDFIIFSLYYLMA